MESNDMKERVRIKTKEKIAISNIREEFDMKENNKGFVYGLTSCVAVALIGIGIIAGSQNNLINSNKDGELLATLEKNTNSLGKDNGNEGTGIDDFTGEISTTTEYNDEIHINNIDKMAMTALDADVKILNNAFIPRFEYLEKLGIPEDFDNKENMKAIYIRSDITKDNYDVLNNYVFEYRNTNNDRSIVIAFSEEYKPLRDYYINNEKNKISKINDAEFNISSTGNMYIVEFSYKGINFDIETVSITEDEMIFLLESLVKGISSYDKNKTTESIDADVGTEDYIVNASKASYPSYFGGRYTENGKNIILLVEDTKEHRKDICKLLNVSEDATEFKKARFSYGYLEELQSKISEGMSNKELSFITASALKDDTNNIVVNVTSKKDSDLNKLKKLDTIGGAIEIKFSYDNAGTEELKVLKEETQTAIECD